MALTVGTRLGPYEILAPLGAGGMGEVYRARDTRLGRDVAVKVLPQHLTASPEDRARFRREAKTISSLNHPHICVLHDVGQEGDIEFLVMELVEGETLAHRIYQGPLPTEDVLRIGAQIASALDRAHRAGVVHRDLKPSNVMLTKSGAKLMDFGLAREARRVEGDADATTVTEPGSPAKSEESITKKGTIVGTFQYMAPEQLEGKRADARCDLWALGCVLYEMAMGKRAFEGTTPVSVISAIMRDQPRAMADLASLTSPAFEQVVKQCLAKDPEERIQTAHDVKLQLQWIAESGSRAEVAAPIASRRTSRERVAWGLLAVLMLVAGWVVATQLMPKPTAKSMIFELPAPRQIQSVDLPRISPDGRILAFNATDSAGVQSIWVRQMNSLDAQRLPGTEGGTRPFWSPDSRFLAFFAGGKLYKTDITGGPPIAICDAPKGADGSWSRRGVILFDGPDSVQSVSASGGVPAGATRIDRKRGETSTAWPQFLPDGRHFLYIAYSIPYIANRPGVSSGTLMVGALGSMDVKSLGPAVSRVEYASGSLLFVRQGMLMAQPFDTDALKFTGDPFPVAENVEADRVGDARFSTSSEGTLVYRSGGRGATNRLVWTDRRGERIGTVGPAGSYQDPALSPDGTRLAVKQLDPSTQTGDLWLWDLSRDVGSRFTFAKLDAISPVWSPDGSRVLYSMARKSFYDLYVKRVDGSGEDSLIYASDEQKYADAWSADGRWIVWMAFSPTVQGWDICGLSLGGSERPTPLVATPFAEAQAEISPDGRWLAYFSNESGSSEPGQTQIYVQSFPGPGGRWRLSTSGGLEPAWRGDSRELYYLTPDNKLMAVELLPGSPPRFSPPRKLFDAPVGPQIPVRNRYVVTPDGQRFLLVVPQVETKVGATTVVLDWLGRLKRR